MQRGFPARVCTHTRCGFLHSVRSFLCLGLLLALAGSPVGGAPLDTGERGPYRFAKFSVTTTNLVTRDLLTTDIYCPLHRFYLPGTLAGTGEAVGATAGPPYPAILFAPGLLASSSTYPGDGEQLASWGYVVAIPKFPNEEYEARVSDMQYLLTYLEEQNIDRNSRLYGQIDTSRFGVAGHSRGANSSIMAAGSDRRVRAVVALDPGSRPPESGGWNYPALAPHATAPLAIIGGAPQACNLNSSYNTIYSYIGAEHKARFIIIGASHCDFIDTDDLLQRIGCYAVCGGTFSADRVRLAEKYMTAWFNYYLRGQPDFYTDLYGVAAGRDIEHGLTTREIPAYDAPRTSYLPLVTAAP